MECGGADLSRIAAQATIRGMKAGRGRLILMKQIATITFQDADSSGEAVAIVRSDQNHVALCLSLLSDGDIEVVMRKVDATKLIEALKNAVTQE